MHDSTTHPHLKLIRRSLIGGMVVVACLVGLAATTTASTTDSSGIQMRAMDARLTQVLETVAASTGLEARVSPSVIDRSERVSDTLSGDAEDTLRDLAEQFDLTVYIKDGIAWIDGIDENHSASIDATNEVAQQVHDTLAQESAALPGAVRVAGDRLELNGSREFVDNARLRAGSLIRQIKQLRQSDATPQTPVTAEQKETTPEPDLVSKPAVIVRRDRPSQEAPASNATAPEIPVEPTEVPATELAITPAEAPKLDVVAEPIETPAPEAKVTRSSAPTVEKPAPSRSIRSITDVPGFDTEYTN